MNTQKHVNDMKFYTTNNEDNWKKEEHLVDQAVKTGVDDWLFTKFDSSKYNTEKIEPEQFNGQITFGAADNTHMNNFYNKPSKTDIRNNSRSNSINNIVVASTTTNQTQNIVNSSNNNNSNSNNNSNVTFPKNNSLRQWTPQILSNNLNKKSNKSSKYNVSYFNDNIGFHNSYISVILHWLYSMKSLRNYILSSSFDNQIISEIKNILRLYPENRKLDITSLRRYISDTFKNGTSKNKFEYNQPNDPCELYYALLNTIHSINSNDANNINSTLMKNCNCVAHKTLFLNLTKIDECECMEKAIQNCSGCNYITDIPIDHILQKSMTKTDNIYFSREKLLYYFKSLIQTNNTNVACPWNGSKCNFNRVQRTVKLNNYKPPTHLLFAFDYLNVRQYTWFDILHALILIPMSFEIDNLFTVSNELSSTGDGVYEYLGLVFKKPSKTFSCMIKSLRNTERHVDWVYYDDEMVFVYTSWVDIISIALKNGLLPYVLMYQYKDFDENFIDSNDDKKGINKEEFKTMELYARRWDGYCMNSGNRIRVKEGLFEEHIRKDREGLNKRSNNESSQDMRVNGNWNSNTRNQQSSNPNPYKKERQRSDSYGEYNGNNNNNNNPNINNIFIDESKLRKYENMPLQMNRGSNQKNINYGGVPNTNPPSNNPYKWTNNHGVHSQIPPPSSNQNLLKTLKPTIVHKQQNTFYTGSNMGSNHEIYPNNPIAKSTDINEAKHQIIIQEDRIRPYHDKRWDNPKLKTEQSKRYPQIPKEWQCQNCDNINKELEFECKKCRIINSRQKDCVEYFSKISNKSSDNIKSPSHYPISKLSNVQNIPINNWNNEFKKVSCVCYTNDKDSFVKNGICTLCDRKWTSNNSNNNNNGSFKKSIIEKEIVFKSVWNNQKKSRSKDSSPENNYIVRPKSSHLQNQYNSNNTNNGSNNKKILIGINRYNGGDDENDIKTGYKINHNNGNNTNKTALDMRPNTMTNNGGSKYKNTSGNTSTTGNGNIKKRMGDFFWYKNKK